jgi:hypothetical protein
MNNLLLFSEDGGSSFLRNFGNQITLCHIAKDNNLKTIYIPHPVFLATENVRKWYCYYYYFIHICEELVTSTDSVFAKFVGYNLKVSKCLHVLIIDLGTIFHKFLYDLFPHQISLTNFIGLLTIAIKLKDKKMFARPSYYLAVHENG